MANDLWRTPSEVIDYIQNRFGEIKIDLCASKDNAVCEHFLDESCNFLSTEWIYGNSMIKRGELSWFNPPYSNPLPFVQQAIKWAAAGYAVAGILNNDSSTKWFVELQKRAAILMPITGGRISFLDGEGKAIRGNNKPQIMFYLAPFGAVSQSTEYVDIKEIYG